MSALRSGDRVLVYLPGTVYRRPPVKGTVYWVVSDADKSLYSKPIAVQLDEPWRQGNMLRRQWSFEMRHVERLSVVDEIAELA